MGERSDQPDAQAMAELTGSRRHVSGLYTPGAHIWEQTPVTALIRDRGGWRASTRRGRVSAGRAILANNGRLEGCGFAGGLLMHVILYASMTVALVPEALKALGGRPRCGLTPSEPMGAAMRRIDGPLGGGRIVTRTCASFLPGMEASEADLRHAAAVCKGLGATRSTLTGIAAAEHAMRVESDATRHVARAAPPVRLPPRPPATFGANAFLRFGERRAVQEQAARRASGLHTARAGRSAR